MKIATFITTMILSCAFCSATAQEIPPNVLTTIKNGSNEDLCTLMGMLYVAKEPHTKNVYDYTKSELTLRGEHCLPKEKYIALGQQKLIEIRAQNARNNSPGAGTKILNFFGAMANAYVQGRYGSSGNRVSTQSGPLSCSSDLDCGTGKSCLKRPFESSGICTTSVDENGLPTMKLPDLNSIGPRTTLGCVSSAQCPVGFQCDLQYKACVR